MSESIEVDNDNKDSKLNFDNLNLKADNDILNKPEAITESSISERRQVVREPRPEAQGKLFYQLKFDEIGRRVFDTRLGIIVFSTLLFSSLALLIYELKFRVDLIEDNLQRNIEHNELITELDNLQTQWSEKELQQIEKNIKRAEAKIFSSIPNLADWLNDKKRSSSRLGLNLRYSIGKANSVDVDGTYSMQVRFYLNSTKQIKNVYSKSLQFIHSLIDENRRLEIISTEFMAGELGVNRFLLTINLWVKDPNGIITIEKHNGANGDAEFIQ